MDGAVTGIDFLQAFRPNAGDQLVEVGVDIIKRDDCERVRLLCDVVRRRGIGSQADIRKLGAALNAAPFQCLQEPTDTRVNTNSEAMHSKYSLCPLIPSLTQSTKIQM
jgi:hypothetical protein